MTSEDGRCIAESAEALGTQTPPPIPSAKYKQHVFCFWRFQGVRNPELPRMAEARGTRLLAVLWLLSAVSATLWPSWGHLGAILGHYCGHLVAILAISRLFWVYLAAFQCYDFGRRTLHSRFVGPEGEGWRSIRSAPPLLGLASHAQVTHFVASWCKFSPS